MAHTSALLIRNSKRILTYNRLNVHRRDDHNTVENAVCPLQSKPSVSPVMILLIENRDFDDSSPHCCSCLLSLLTELVEAIVDIQIIDFHPTLRTEFVIYLTLNQIRLRCMISNILNIFARNFLSFRSASRTLTSIIQ